MNWKRFIQNFTSANMETVKVTIVHVRICFSQVLIMSLKCIDNARFPSYRLRLPIPHRRTRRDFIYLRFFLL